jgi:cytochrome c553
MNEYDPYEYTSNIFHEKKVIETRQKLYNNGGVKECGRCHQIKTYKEYASRMMRGNKTLRSICKSCKIQTEQIYRFRNKMRVVQNIYDGELKGKCQNCNTGIERLPTLEYHHPYPNLKNKNNINFNQNWMKTKQRLEDEKVSILCVNCHSKESSHIFNKYKEIIQKREFGPDTTNKEIKLYVKSQISNPAHHNRVVQLIKKNEVIKQLYTGKCVACRKISTSDYLPALHFHHREKGNTHPGSETFNAIKNKEIRIMKNQLKEENCVAICANCHKMDRTFHFKNLYKEVLSPELWKQVEKDYKSIRKNVADFEFKEE